MIHLQHRQRLLLVVATLIVGAVSASSTARGQQNSTDVIAEIEKRADHQRSTLCEYSGIRNYILQNKHLKHGAEMKVRLTCRSGQGKRFQILSMQATGVARRSLRRMLEEELKTTKEEQDKNAIDSSNYQFTLVGEEDSGNRKCYKLKLKPRRRSKYLIDGLAWISIEDHAVVRISGNLAKSPSFWIKRAKIEEQFNKVDQFWMPFYSHSSARVVFVGEVYLTIEYSDYQIRACPTR